MARVPAVCEQGSAGDDRWWRKSLAMEILALWLHLSQGCAVVLPQFYYYTVFLYK